MPVARVASVTTQDLVRFVLDTIGGALYRVLGENWHMGPWVSTSRIRQLLDVDGAIKKPSAWNECNKESKPAKRKTAADFMPLYLKERRMRLSILVCCATTSLWDPSARVSKLTFQT